MTKTKAIISARFPQGADNLNCDRCVFKKLCRDSVRETPDADLPCEVTFAEAGIETFDHDERPGWVAWLNRPKYRKTAVKSMVRLYGEGLGCLRIGNIFHLHSEIVYQCLKEAGVTFRPRYSKLLPKIEFNGLSFTWSGKGYYRCTTGDRAPLHHHVWEFHNGPVPEDHEIIVLNGDYENWDIANLACMSKADATRYFHPLQPTPNDRKCLYCGEPIIRRMVRGYRGRLRPETPGALAKRKYCGPPCKGQHCKGKRRGWSPAQEAA